MNIIKFIVRWFLRGSCSIVIATGLFILCWKMYQEANTIGIVASFCAIGLTLLAFVVSVGVVSIGVSLYAWATGD